jgi:hypothetical protein
VGEGTGGLRVVGDAPPARGGRGLRLGALGLAAAVAIAASVVAVIVLRGGGESIEPAALVASIESVDGDVHVVAADGASRSASAGGAVYAEQTIRARDAGARAAVRFDDGTQLVLSGGAALTFTKQPGKSLRVDGGTLLADVAPQPAEAPMVVRTPTATVRVVGTKFELRVDARATDVSVTEGKVQVTRVSDGASVHVAAGQRVVANGGTPLVVSAIDPATGPTPPVPSPPETLPVLWSVDFEDGLPAGWSQGYFEKQGLPTGSRGAVKAELIKDPAGAKLFNITTGEHWAGGMFTVSDDAHLEITFRLERAQWVNLFLLTRPAGDPSSPPMLHLTDRFPWDGGKPGVWRRAVIPLSAFRSKVDGVNFADKPPTAGRLAVSLFFSSPEPDRGLVVDSIRVVRGGPGKVTVQEVK